MDSTHLTAFTVFMGVIGALYPEAIADSTEIMSPRILLPRKCVIRVVPGEQFVMTCKADPGLPDDFTCVYWLVNNTFPDAAYTDGRVSETEEFTSQDGRMIQKSLVFQKVTAEDLRSNFTCVINSPAGIDRKTVKLTPIHKAVNYPAHQDPAEHDGGGILQDVMTASRRSTPTITDRRTGVP
ncbi:hypothetical protein DPEC_G00232650 [Dallia pectoralis]|uniref:Uncharacterized protein n=1 Tax=Dallia pectoralis TaxID=75939 RepID=A0ACC2FXD3_DALPE|nr:hypothetical protein DPEC_G00232650 [Dallia pectoralis]